MLTTEDAAKALGVSKRRVQALINNGQLEAVKASGVWLVDEGSVARRLETVVKEGGRPVRGKSRSDLTFMLMSRTHEIAELVYSTSSRTFTSVGETLDVSRAPMGLGTGKARIPRDELNRWWRGRGIPQTRIGLAYLLDEAGVELPVELVHRNLGLSLSDQYWIRPKGSGLDWEDVNFFTNDFDKVSLATEGFAAEGRTAAAKPDNTSDGNLEKCWKCVNGERRLFKGGTLYGQEAYNEVVATALHGRLLEEGEYVSYRLEGSGAGALCSCPNFLSDSEEYIPATYVEASVVASSGKGDYDHYVACCESLGIQGVREALDRMIVCDDIMANHDRHFRNFGIVRNVETLECRMAPLFDSGSSLWCDLPTTALAAGEHSFSSKQFFESPAKQMLLVEDLGWIDTEALRGFVDEAREILSRNDALGERLPHILRALEWRVARMCNIAEWA